MRHRSTLLPVALMLIALGACAPPAEEAAVEEAPMAAVTLEEMSAIADDFEAAIAAGDAAALLALHTGDSVRMPPNAEAIVGGEAILAAFEAMFLEQEMELSVTTEDVVGLGDHAVAWGTYVVTFPVEEDDPLQESGKWMNLLEKQADGTWKIARHIWNTNGPLPEM